MDDQRETEEFKQHCLDCLNRILHDIQRLGDGVYVLDDDQLATLNVRKAAALDIEQDVLDFAPRFFSPRFSLDQARRETIGFLEDHGRYLGYDEWPKRCRRGSCSDFFDDSEGAHNPEAFHPLCSPQAGAEFRLRWFLNALGTDSYKDLIDSADFGVWETSEWGCLNEVDLVPGRMFNLPSHCPSYTRVGNPPRSYSFHVCHAFLLEDPSADKPHVGGTVVDAAEAEEGEVLRSEVAAAVGLLKHQFRRDDFCRHHTLPALVFSFQHDRFGRITQFHFDGESLVMRQSRLLDFRSDEPTTDAYHMIRWMANRPDR